MRARRDEQGALLVCLDGVQPADGNANGGVVTRTRVGLLDERDSALTPERARALTEFATGLLDPMVGRLAQQEEVIREQAEEIGRLQARLEIQVNDPTEKLAPAFARQMAELAAIREEIERLSSKRRWWPFT